MSNMSNHPNIVKLEAKTAEGLEGKLTQINRGFTPIAIYGMNGRHYAWLSLHTGVKKKVVSSKTRASISKTEKVNL